MAFSKGRTLLGIILVASMVAVGHSQRKLSAREEVNQIRELARMIRQTDGPSDLTVQNLLQWLQGRYEPSGARKARQQFPSREYLPSFPSNEGLNKPRPFQRPQESQSSSSQDKDQSGSFQPPQESQSSSSQDKDQSGSFQRPGENQSSFSDSKDQSGSNFDSLFDNDFTSTESQFDLPEESSTSQSDSGTTESPNEDDSPFSNFGSDSDNQGYPPAKSDRDNSLSGKDERHDHQHPPHVHAIEVQCAKDMMTITVEFDREFNGVIYSKGFYNIDNCRYVAENSGQQKYTFKVSLDSCGTQFVDQFAQGGQAYLENMLVIQNEAGIQEVWDTVRTVRCSWEGSIKQDLSVSLIIGMLTQETVTFNGDTGKARLDIQVGKGPFAAPANGVVKIGETMTLVVYVEGDSEFDVVVRQCQAKDSSGEKSIMLFDERGCVLKPKLFGAFQKTRETGNTGASLIAYAYFSAFKFPDEMDLVIECNVELCKANCEMCPEEQKFEPGRRRRRDLSYNETFNDFGQKVSGRFRIIAEEDLTALEIREHLLPSDYKGICFSTQSFIISSLVILFLLLVSSITSATMWYKLNQKWQSKC